MARRNLDEINAGSMADIAFLLLVFFLVTTTMDRDTGLLRLLPPPLDEEVIPPIIKERNVFEVLANANDQLLVEKNLMDIEDLRDAAKEFMTNTSKSTELPTRQTVRASDVATSLATAQRNLKSDSTSRAFKIAVKKWERKQQTIDLIGEYEELPPTAVISLQNDRGTTYELYCAVQNELAAAIRELRDELCLDKFDISYSDLDLKTETHQGYATAAKAVHPMRISEAEPRSTGSGN
jgi:biopolymer transport protein ExbD